MRTAAKDVDVFLLPEETDFVWNVRIGKSGKEFAIPLEFSPSQLDDLQSIRKEDFEGKGSDSLYDFIDSIVHDEEARVEIRRLGITNIMRFVDTLAKKITDASSSYVPGETEEEILGN